MKYLVTGTIKHNGKTLKVGGTIELDQADGDPLVHNGYLVAAPAAAESDDSGKKATDKKAGK